MEDQATENVEQVEEVVTEPQVVEEPVDMNVAFMEAAANGDMEAFLELEKKLVEGDSVEETVKGEATDGTVEEETQQQVEEGVEQAPAEDKEVEHPATAELRRQLEERDRRINELMQSRMAPPSPTQRPAQQTQPQQGFKFDVPELPKRPQGVSYDPAEWSSDDVKSMESYYSAMDNYTAKQNEVIRALSENGLGQVNSRVEAIERHYATEQQKLEQERQEMALWDSIRSFQGTSKEFATGTDIRDIHRNLLEIGDKLARAANFYPDPNNAQAQQKYEQNKNFVLQEFLKGNEKYVEMAKAVGIERNEDIDKYMKIKGVMDYKSQAVQTGRLGNSSPLQTAYLDMLATTGDLSKLIDGIATDQRASAYKDRAEAVSAAQSAVRTPSAAGVGQQSDNPKPMLNSSIANNLLGQGLSQDEVEFFLRVNERPELLQDSKNLTRFEDIDKRVRF
jgi:hypothetical protein